MRQAHHGPTHISLVAPWGWPDAALPATGLGCPNFRHGLVEGLWRQPGRRPPAPTRLECGEGLLELPYSGDANALMSIR